MTNKYEQGIIQRLVDMNERSGDTDRCGTIGTCHGIVCMECPLGPVGTTLGTIRKMDDRVGAAVEPPAATIEGVTKPSHYMLFDNVEAIEVIARSMTVSEFRGYCLGNILKYRLRAGKKSELAYIEKDLAKADFYKELFEKHKGLCHAGD